MQSTLLSTVEVGLHLKYLGQNHLKGAPLVGIGQFFAHFHALTWHGFEAAQALAGRCSSNCSA